ncbi:helix-turn-helix domain-containing protein [Bacillus solitudinis]|uniref:helix-turn-helix domain-containing protein n=1 Tax=Bacillus solitudinis TaxID=2014074 RepID=UPI000C24691D|nr:helix-turn-helix transcriptional regulator [Bacillus solitudinis]
MSKKAGLAYIAEVFDITLTELAEKLGVTKQQLNSWVNGNRPIPKKWLEKMKEIEEFRDIPDSYFTGELNWKLKHFINYCYYAYRHDISDNEEDIERYWELMENENDELLDTMLRNEVNEKIKLRNGTYHVLVSNINDVAELLVKDSNMGSEELSALKKDIIVLLKKHKLLKEDK